VIRSVSFTIRVESPSALRRVISRNIRKSTRRIVSERIWFLRGKFDAQTAKQVAFTEDYTMRRTSVAAAIFATGLVAAAGFSGVPAAKSAAKDSAKTAPAFLKLASGRAIVRDGANGAPL